MKRLFYFLVILLFCSVSFAQNILPYQAVVRDANGQLISNRQVRLDWELQHNNGVVQDSQTAMTNKQGLATIYMSVPADIEWNNATIKVDVTYDNTTIPGVAMPIYPVPSAIYSENTNIFTLPLVHVVQNLSDTTLPTEGAVLRYGDDMQTAIYTDMAILDARIGTAEQLLSCMDPCADTNVQANWAETDPTSDAFIQNKPDLNAFISSIRDSVRSLFNFVADLRDSIHTLQDSLNALANRELPEITGIELTGFDGEYDAAPHGVTLTGTQTGDLTIYIVNGIPTFTPPTETEEGTTTVNVIISRAGFRDWTGSADIVITPPTAVAVATANSPICTGATLNLSSNGSSTGADISYSWSGPNSYSSTDANPTISNVTSSASGTYTLTVTKNATYTATATVEVVIVSGAASTISLCEDLDGGTVTLNSFTGVNNIKIYAGGTLKKELTTLKNGMSLVDRSDNFANGTYTVLATNTAGCSVVKSMQVQYKPSSCTGISTILSNETGSNGSITAVRDHENNSYTVVQIGDLCWMRENMRAKTTPGGTTIYENPANSYSYSGEKAYAYNNDESLIAKHGLLYNWNAAVDTFNTTLGISSMSTNTDDAVSCFFTGNRRGICPEGWHVPNTFESSTLFDHCISNAGGKLAGGCDWETSNTAGAPGDYSFTERNTTLFQALPSGYRQVQFQYFGSIAYFWSATYYQNKYNAYYYSLNNNETNLDYYYYTKDSGYSVRCVRD